MGTEGTEATPVFTGGDDVLTIRETASFLKLSDQHVRRLAEAGELPGRKLGDRWRFSRQALLRHLEGEFERESGTNGVASPPS
ncbi:MAG: binding domain protein excisionase family [Pseudonocardia sp.]|nr:binding domain protein excisionase family [Pseudonocardia sp.]